jgi:hypothetical protein
MNLIVAGHQRSGTSLVRRICDQHPEISLTLEFANYLPMGRPYPSYMNRMLRRLWQVRARPGILPSGKQPSRWVRSNVFFVRYLLNLRPSLVEPVGPQAIEAALSSLLPNARFVGDKYPDYLFELETFLGHPNLKWIVIYRDARDVASSTLIMTRGAWQGAHFAQKMNTPAKVAERWNRAIAIMESHKQAVLALRYEDLVSRPREELTRLGSWLDVDPDGFPIDGIHDESVGKHRAALSAAELKTVAEIAGPTLQRLGYEL